MRSAPEIWDDSWLPITIEIPDPEPIALIHTPCSNQCLTFPLPMKFCHSSIYNLTLFFCFMVSPSFPVRPVANAPGLEMDFASILLLLSLSNAFSPTSCGWRSCLSLPSSKAGSSVCQRFPTETALLTGEGHNTVSSEGHQACQPKPPLAAYLEFQPRIISAAP